MADIRKRVGPPERDRNGNPKIDPATGQTKHETRWQARIRMRGYSPTRTFKLKSEAVEWATNIESEIRRGVYEPEVPGTIPTVKQALERYVREVTSKKAAPGPEGARAKRVGKRAFGKKRLDRLSSVDLAQYRDQRLQAGRSPHDVRLDLALLSHLFSTARREWGMKRLSNPVTLVTKPKLPEGRDRRLQPGELDALLKQAERYGGDIGEVIRFALETGMRAGEIVGLRREHVDCGKRICHIPRTKDAKVIRGRDVPLSNRALAILYRQAEREDDRFWNFKETAAVSRAFGRIRDRAREAYEAECAENGGRPDPKYLTDLRFHDLRHEATSRLIERGLGIMEAMAITGHKGPTMLKRYTHLRAEDLVDKLG